MTTCRDCEAPVRWALTNNGKRTLLEAEPTDDGNVALLPVQIVGDRLDVAVVLSGDALDRAKDGGATLRRSHFASCPNADQRRKR